MTQEGTVSFILNEKRSLKGFALTLVRKLIYKVSKGKSLSHV